jgi:hypothetical protein
MPFDSNLGPISDRLSVTAPLKPGDIVQGDVDIRRAWTGVVSSDLANPDNWRDLPPPAPPPKAQSDPTAKEHPYIGKLRRSGMLAE